MYTRLIAALCSLPIALPALSASPRPFAADATLRDVAEASGLLVGAAVAPRVLDDERYARTLGREFNFVTAENVMKWWRVHPEPDRWEFGPADQLVAFAAEHDMKVKGHTLIWHQALPEYINAEMSADALRSALHNHIRTLVGHYKGKVYAWDVINEAVDDKEGLRKTLFLEKLGEGYLAEAFRVAHEADPDALLIYNDYGAEGLNAKSDRVYALVSRLVADGVPIHGVGLQMHIKAHSHPAIEDIVANVRRLVALGLHVNISEMDVRIKEVPGDVAARLAVQRKVYHDVIAACVKEPGFIGVTFWGFTDAHSWVDKFFGEDDPLLFDEQYRPKPAYAGVRDALSAARGAADALVAQFAEPRPEFSPVPIWWWSGDAIERDRLREQLEHIAAGGIHNAIILNLAPSGPLYGSAADEPPFLTEAWWDLFGYALDVAKRVGVRLWFYDQLGFSGSGLQARVVAQHPEFRGVELRRDVRDVTGPGEVEVRTPPGGTALAAFVAERAEVEDGTTACWIWDVAAVHTVSQRFFRRRFEVTTLPARAEVHITCDNAYVLHVNGVKIGEERSVETSGWKNAERYDIGPHLRIGANVVAIEAENLGSYGGLLVEVALTDAAESVRGAKPTFIVSDGSFRVSPTVRDGWTTSDYDDRQWASAHVIGAMPVAPWGVVSGMDTLSAALFGTAIRNVRNVTDRINDGILRVAVPAGEHRVQLLYTVTGGFDYHNPDAGAALIDVVHGEMERRFGAELGKGIAGSFQDEFPPLPRFSHRLPAEFRTRMGYDLLARLPALYDDVIDRFGEPDGPTTAQIRCQANQVAAALAEEAFFVPLHEWHEKHGLLCGYDQTVRNADPIGGERYYVDYFKTMRHYSVPGNDHGGDAKPHQSIADLYERPRVWIEAFHSSGWGQTLEEIAVLLHPWLADGATLYNPHAIYYSTHGSFYEWAPPDTGWRQPYFAHYSALADYVSRLCWMLTQGRHVADVAIVHPASTVHACTGFGPGMAAAQEAHDMYWAVQGSLRQRRVDYLIIDEDSIQRANVADGVLTVGQARLRAIVLPATRVLAGETLVQLVRFAEQGGLVLALGEFPGHAANRALAADAFDDAIDALKDKATRVDAADQVAGFVEARFGRDVTQTLPALHRRLGNRELYFVMSDDGTPPNFNAQYAINQRKLWELPAAQGGWLEFDVAADGVPEQWDAATGRVTRILNYRRADGRTAIWADLGATPAPLVAIRPARPDEPLAIESDLQIVDYRHSGAPNEPVIVRGWPRLDRSADAAAEHTARITFADGLYEARLPAVVPSVVNVAGPLACQLEPTCDNQYGDFAWPPSAGPMPVEIRSFRFRRENPGDDSAPWASADFDDSAWETVIASYGPRAESAGPIAGGKLFETIEPSAAGAATFKPIEYSLKLGINEDPIYPSALGGKGRIPEEFIDLGPTKAGDVFVVRTLVTLPADAPVAATLRIGGAAKKRAFLNGEAVHFEGDPAARILRATVEMRPGVNRLELLAARVTDGRLRLFYQFLPAEGVMPDAQWIWSETSAPAGQTRFTKRIAVPGPIQSAAMVVALGDLHQIRINDKLVADQGNFDPYFTGRSERYDITSCLRPGENVLEITARDTGTPTGLLLDGLVKLIHGGEVAFVSDASFRTTAVGDAASDARPARLLAGPAHGYFGETATLLLRPRPHPLPLAGWLVGDPPPPAPFDRLVFAAATSDAPPAGWYRFRLPPGATIMTLRTPGRAALHVNGELVSLTPRDGAWTASLPNPDSPERIAALRIESIAGFARGAAIVSPITFEVGAGRMPFGSWDQLGLPHYSGGIRYSARVTLAKPDGAKLILDLGRVRGSVDVTVNGTPCGTRIWHPYRFDITDAATAGANQIELRVLNTLGPHFGVGHPSAHVFENQTQSGLFGPVSVTAFELVEMTLPRVSASE
ncbi:MAG: endo-1,4-beta-xylanase [Phycisphaerae bacterium]|nr:endo-1,4-beta-xylanase [Phycisphaerae bacterium]